MGIIAETWLVDERVQLKVHRLTGRHRLIGAITIGVPAPGEALMFCDCRSLHGWLMRASLDVAFLDAEGLVLRVTKLQPWRVRSCRSAEHALELADGEALRLGIAPGTSLKNISF